MTELLASGAAGLLAEKSGPEPHTLAATESTCGCRGLQGALEAGGRGLVASQGPFEERVETELSPEEGVSAATI